MTHDNQIGRAVRRALILSAVAASTTLPVYAQDQQKDSVEEIVVTGSRIARPDLEASSPITVVRSEDLKIAGTTSAEEYLRDLPQLVPAMGSNTNNGNNGSATLDLRNLGEERTLILVDGRRFVPYDSNGIVDLNMIPSSLIDRVEIVTGGASAVYGSDAIAGVVNFVLKSDFEGLEIEGFAGQTAQSDGARQDFSATLGANFADGRGNMVLNVGFTTQDAAYQGDRDYSRFSLTPDSLSPGGSSTNVGGTIQGIAAGGPGQPSGVYAFDDSGNLVPYVASRDAFNYNPFNLLQTPQEKWTATVLGRYEISDQAEFFSRFSFANSRVTTIIAPSATFNYPFVVNYATNPFLNAQARSVLTRNDPDGDGIVEVKIGRRLVELGTRDSIYENTAYQAVGGVRGGFGESWNWEVFAQQGRTVRTQNYLNDINVDRLRLALLATRDASNNIVCGQPDDGCVPANIFGPGKLTPEAAEYIQLDLQQNDTTDQFVTGAFVGGDLPFTSPLAATAPAIVIGAEYRSEESQARPDASYAAGISPGFGQSRALDASLNITEVYGELKAPLITDRMLVRSLSLEAGFRRSDYSNEVPAVDASNDFTTTAWKAGGEWQPVQDVRFRALYQRAVRAPNLNEIGAPRANGTGDANNDYCASESFTPAEVANPDNAALRDLCVATGAPLAGLLGGSIGGPISGQVNNFTGGNPDLVPEESKTITIGMVLQPSFLPAFTASIDYFDIKVEKAILATPEQAILDACYTTQQNPGLDPNNLFCRLIHRDPLDGALNGDTQSGVDASSRNVGFLHARGVDLAAAYGFDMGNLGNLGLALNLTRQLKTDLRFTESGPVYECVGTVGDICLRPTPEWRWIQSTTWTRGPVALQVRWRRIGELTKDSVARGEDLASDYAVPTIDARDYFDLSGSFAITDAITVRAGVDNVMDDEPPIVGNDYGGTAPNSGNTFPATYDPLGRSYFVSATARF